MQRETLSKPPQRIYVKFTHVQSSFNFNKLCTISKKTFECFVIISEGVYFYEALGSLITVIF